MSRDAKNPQQNTSQHYEGWPLKAQIKFNYFLLLVRENTEGKMGEGDQEVQTSSCKISGSQVRNTQSEEYIQSKTM